MQQPNELEELDRLGVVEREARERMTRASREAAGTDGGARTGAVAISVIAANASRSGAPIRGGGCDVVAIARREPKNY